MDKNGPKLFFKVDVAFKIQIFGQIQMTTKLANFYNFAWIIL